MQRSTPFLLLSQTTTIDHRYTVAQTIGKKEKKKKKYNDISIYLYRQKFLDFLQ